MNATRSPEDSGGLIFNPKGSIADNIMTLAAWMMRRPKRDEVRKTMDRRVLRRRFCAAALGLALALPPAVPVQAAVPSYLKAVTYVSDAWVTNFWNTESDHMEEELAQIAADGFNCIVLAIPWREFQPTVMPASYNSYAMDKLDKIMEAANRHGLAVEFRVGYTWDYYADENAPHRFKRLLQEPEMQAAWLDYVGQLYEAGSAHPNFHGGFLTWEDFWNYLESAGDFGTGGNSRREAGECGYQDYLREHYTIEQLNEIYQPETAFEDYSDVYIPERRNHAFRLFYEFYDAFLNKLLAESQERFPNLSMEVRLDVDPVENKEGTETMGVPHYGTFSCGNSGYTSLMYSVSMGRSFGQMISASDAIHTMNEQLSIVKDHNGGKPIFIDQLLYMDVTEGFENNARLLESHRGLFLMSLPTTLRTYTNGYAVWTYRNYTNNPVYNCQFALGSRGWETKNASTQEHNGSMQMHLQPGGTIIQKIGHRIGGRTTHDNFVRFTAESSQPVTLTVSLGKASQQVQVNGAGSFELNLGPVNFYDVTFQADGPMYLDNIQVYNFIQDGQLRDVDGSELSCMGAMRILNGAMN